MKQVSGSNLIAYPVDNEQNCTYTTSTVIKVGSLPNEIVNVLIPDIDAFFHHVERQNNYILTEFGQDAEDINTIWTNHRLILPYSYHDTKVDTAVTNYIKDMYSTVNVGLATYDDNYRTIVLRGIKLRQHREGCILS